MYVYVSLPLLTGWTIIVFIVINIVSDMTQLSNKLKKIEIQVKVFIDPFIDQGLRHTCELKFRLSPKLRERSTIISIFEYS